MDGSIDINSSLSSHINVENNPSIPNDQYNQLPMMRSISAGNTGDRGSVQGTTSFSIGSVRRRIAGRGQQVNRRH